MTSNRITTLLSCPYNMPDCCPVVDVDAVCRHSAARPAGYVQPLVRRHPGVGHQQPVSHRAVHDARIIMSRAHNELVAHLGRELIALPSYASICMQFINNVPGDRHRAD